MLISSAPLILLWGVAGVLNCIPLFSEDTPSALGTAATLVAIGSWLIAGWLAGRRSGSVFIRRATFFWIAVLAITPVIAWVWDRGVGVSGFLLLASIFHEGLPAGLKVPEPALCHGIASV